MTGFGVCKHESYQPRGALYGRRSVAQNQAAPCFTIALCGLKPDTGFPFPEKCSIRFWHDGQFPREVNLEMPVIFFAVLVVVTFTLLGTGIHYYEYGSLNWIFFLMALFLSTNLLIASWETCLYFRRDYIESRSEYWYNGQKETGRSPGVEFLMSRVSLRSAFSLTFWADVWAAYSFYDASYADRRTFGFIADIGNGFLTPIPTLILYAAFTVGFMPAVYAGILGIALFWQWTYVSSLYWVSFLVAARQHRISKRNVYVYVFSPNAVWILFPLLGLYVSTHLIIDGHYGILGH